MYPDNAKLSGAFIHIFYSFLFLLDLPKIPKKTPPPQKIEQHQQRFSSLSLLLSLSFFKILLQNLLQGVSGNQMNEEGVAASRGHKKVRQ